MKASQIVLEKPMEDTARTWTRLSASESPPWGIELSHRDKIMYPSTEITKAHLVAYYAASGRSEE